MGQSQNTYRTKVIKKNRQGIEVFTGEIYWVGRHGWHNAGGFSSNTHKQGHPGLVCKNSRKHGKPVYLVPGSTSTNFYNTRKFTPKYPFLIDDHSHLKEGGHFVLDYKQPVAKRLIGNRQGKLSSKDRQRFEKEIKANL